MNCIIITLNITNVHGFGSLVQHLVSGTENTKSQSVIDDMSSVGRLIYAPYFIGRECSNN